MAPWKIALLSTALYASIALSADRAQGATTPAPARVISSAHTSRRDSSASLRVRLVRWNEPQELSSPFGALARPVSFKPHSGKATRKHFDSPMVLEWSYLSAVPTGPGPVWAYHGERANVRSHLTRFRTFDETEEDYAPSWSAHSDLAPAGGFGDLVSLVISYHESASGAHGSSFQKFVTLSGKTGLPLKLSQVLNAEACARIRSAIADSLAPEPPLRSTLTTLNERFAVAMAQDTLRVRIALNYVFDGTDSPASTFIFELPPSALLPRWRPTK